MGEISQMVSSIGFPCFVAIWMLYKGSKDSEALKDTVSELKNAITELSTLVGMMHKESHEEKDDV